MRFEKLLTKTATLFVMGTLSLPVSAIDLELNRPLDSRSKGGVSSADTIDAGKSYISLTANRSLSLLPENELVHKTISDEEKATSLLNRTARASVILSYGLFSDLELNIGASGSFEEATIDNRDQVFKSAFTDTEDEEFKNLDYAGTSLMLKYKIYENERLRFALAPYVYEGLGQKAEYSLTRSKSVRGGWKGVASYAQGLFSFDLNFGYRYRKAQELYGIRVRNSKFAESALSINLSRNFSVFINGKVDSLKVSEDAKSFTNDDKRVYESRLASEYGGGINYETKDYLFSLFGAGSYAHTRGLGYGKSHVGVSIGLPINKSYARTRIAERKEEKRLNHQKKENAPIANPYPEMDGNIDYMSDLQDSEAFTKDDMDAMEQKLKDEKSKDQFDIDLVEQELEALKKAEKEAEQRQQEIIEQNRKRNRSEQLAKMKERQKYVEKTQKEIEEELNEDGLDISTEDVEWNGLD